MKDIEFGIIHLKLNDIMAKNNISINKPSFRAEMQRTQLKHYFDGDIQRLDMAVLCRLCYALDCDLHNLL